jgi:hypothetical protein
VATNSKHRVFVADLGAKAVHVFDFIRSKYSRLRGRGNRLHPETLLFSMMHCSNFVTTQPSDGAVVFRLQKCLRCRTYNLSGDIVARL